MEPIKSKLTEPTIGSRGREQNWPLPPAPHSCTYAKLLAAAVLHDKGGAYVLD